jgi:hypothetical protein
MTGHHVGGSMTGSITGNLLRMRSHDEMHTAGIFLSSLRPAIVNAFSQTPACVILIPCHGWPRASPDAGPPSMDYVYTNSHGPEIHRAFRLLNGGFRT